MKSSALNNKLLEDLRTLILNRTGLFEVLKNEQKLHDIILSCFMSSGLRDINDFYWELEKDENLTGPHWATLLTHITVPESFFFRDEGQLNLLRSIILPKIFENAKTARSIKIWSAGCSGGEEVYTISIILKELLGKENNWSIRIMGTDINSRYIEKAKEGIYTQWSLRTLGSMKTDAWFTRLKSGFRIKDEFRENVEFSTLNLSGVKGKYPAPFEDLDLIICRNVFIYFRHSTIQDIVSKFSLALNPEGYAMFGHAEYVHESNKNLTAHYFPQSVVYQKTGSVRALPGLNNTINIKIKEFVNKAGTEIGKTDAQVEIELNKKTQFPGDQNIHLLKKRNLTETGEFKIKQPSDPEPDSGLKKLIDEARLLADNGSYSEAEKICSQLITQNIFEPYPYFLLGQIAHEKNEIQKAHTYLKKVLYLKSDHIGAMVELASVYQALQDDDKALRLRKKVALLLEKMNPETKIADYDDISASELLTLIKNYI